MAAGYAIDNAFLNLLAENSNAFTVALGLASANPLDFSSSGAGATLPNASLGAVGAFTYSNTLTPNGTTYRLGGGDGALTVSSSTLTGDRTLVVTGPGTVILSGTANTFSGDVTVNSGTLQVNSAGALNNIPRAVAVNNGATANFSAADAANGSTVSITGGTANVTVANAVNGARIGIGPGGLLYAYNVQGGYTGSAIYLDGGKVILVGVAALAPIALAEALWSVQTANWILITQLELVTAGRII